MDPSLTTLAGTVLIFLAGCSLILALGFVLASPQVGGRIEDLLHRHFFVELRINYGLSDAAKLVLPLAGVLALAGFAMARTLFGLGVGAGIVLALAAAALSVAAPMFVYSKRRAERQKALELNLPAALQQLASYASGGSSLQSAFASAVETAPWPLNEEFDLITKRADAVGLVEALEIARGRLRSESFDLAVSVIKVGEGPGGDTVSALRSLADTFLELERLRNKILSASSQVRRSMQLMSVVLVVMIALGIIFMPDRVDEALNSTIGIVMLVAAALLYLTALAWMKSLTRFDV